MKKPLLFGIILTACVVIGTFLFAQFYPGGMISYWTFDESEGAIAYDSVDANNGALVNAPTWVPSKFNYALDFNTANYVQVANSASLEPENITVEAWVKRYGYPGNTRYIVSKYLSIKQGCCSSYALYTSDGGIRFYVTRNDVGFPYVDTPVGGKGIWDGEWHHVAGTFDGTKLELYIDGSSAGSEPFTAGILYSDIGINDLFFGSYTSSSSYSFIGGIDEVAIYNRGLSAGEIQQHYQDGSYEVECTTPPDNMVSWWPGDETTGVATEDIVDANDGILIGGATFAPGMVGQAFSLDGSGYVKIPDAPELKPAEFTLDAWVKPNTLRAGGWDSVISHGASGSGPLGTWLDSYWLGFFDGKPRFHTAHQMPSGDHPISGPDSVTLNEWHHIAGSFDGITKKLYLDGNLVASTVIASPIVYAEVPVLIGEDTNGNVPAGLTFRGLIDEVEIYDHALEASEILAIYIAGSAGKCKVAPNQPPVAVVLDHMDECINPTGTLVTLDGSGSEDPEGHPLTYTWTGPFPEGGGTVTGVSTIVTLPLGTSEVTLVVNDGQDDSVPVTVDITVTVVVNGFLPPLVSLVPECGDAPRPRKAFKQGRTLPLKLQLNCGTTILSGTDVAPPQIVDLVRQGDAIDLDTIDADSGEANDSGTSFHFSDPNWVYNLSTRDLSAGTYVITIEMPDGRRLCGAFVLR